jgi:restriction endonuclease-like protein
VTFAYFSPILRGVPRTLKNVSASALRCELSSRNTARSTGLTVEMSYGSVPSIVYAEDEKGQHGNFLPASYRRMMQQPGWKARLAKVYTGSRFLPRKTDRTRRELECANSSDALLMNIFCYPGILRRSALCSLLGIELGLHATFGFRPRIPLQNGADDRSEIDLKLGKLFIEAKLTEGNFQTARHGLVHRYRDLEAVFDIDRLPLNKEKYRSYQLIRGALAAHAQGACFAVFCDQRRQDLIEDCFAIISAVTSSELRCRLSVVTWQEIAAAMPPKVKAFLSEKYGITAASIADGW